MLSAVALLALLALTNAQICLPSKTDPNRKHMAVSTYTDTSGVNYCLYPKAPDGGWIALGRVVKIKETVDLDYTRNRELASFVLCQTDDGDSHWRTTHGLGTTAKQPLKDFMKRSHLLLKGGLFHAENMPPSGPTGHVMPFTPAQVQVLRADYERLSDDNRDIVDLMLRDEGFVPYELELEQADFNTLSGEAHRRMRKQIQDIIHHQAVEANRAAQDAIDAEEWEDLPPPEF